MLTALCDAIIFTGEAMVENHALLLKDGKIIDIVVNNRIQGDANAVSMSGHILAPGFIDAQINGGGNLLFNNDPTAETCRTIAHAHRAFGTTSLLPTVITDKPVITRHAIFACREARKTDKAILGIHIEGPHLSVERRGIHQKDFIRPLTQDDIRLYQPQDGEVMLITLAPENVRPEDIKLLNQQGAIISLGHTNATPPQIKAAVQAGATGFTHLFNAMGKPGTDSITPADTALADKASWCSIIMDGFHVPNSMALLALKEKPQGKLYLVSDAMPPAANKNPQPFLYGEMIHFENGRCVNSDGTLAGSSITMLDAVSHCVKILGVEIDEALRMAALYPAQFLGVDDRLGKLLPSYEADLVALTPDLELKKVWSKGNPV